MTGGFLAFAFGMILLIAAIRHQKVGEVLQGAIAPNEPQTPKEDTALQAELATTSGVTAGAAAGAVKAGTVGKNAQYVAGGGWAGSQAVVNIAIRIGKRHHLHVTSTKRATRSTQSGGVSDHWVGSTRAYAADQSNGSSPTPEMDATAAEIANAFGLSWSGSGLVNGTYTDPQGRKFRIQMIYRSNIGGNHYNHVHFGARRL